MDKEKEIAAMTAEIQYAMDVVGEKNKTTIAAEALAWYLVERKDYHKADEVCKETAKEIAEWLKSQEYGFVGEIILKKFGVEVNE